MRDRRNTSLSVSSNSSSSSAASGRNSLSEKRCGSPPPSSTLLPDPVTKDNRSRAPQRRLTLLKVISICCALLLTWLCFPHWTSLRSTPFGDPVASNRLPATPAAEIVTAASGFSKWTVSIPHNDSFPLPAEHYIQLCKQGESMRDKLISDSRLARWTEARRKPSYYSQDRTFLDVSEAESIGVLPPTAALPENMCESSLTFALETTDASFGKSLLLLWLSYGLALQEGRAFFVDDTRWPYGSYTSFFALRPPQHCAPPPAHYIVPCPHQARHLVVSAATAPWTFGPLFETEFAMRRVHGMEQYRRIFDMLRVGYDDLFTLVGEDATYAKARNAEMKVAAAAHGGSVVGMHIRRGDLHPHEYQFAQDYLPLERYATNAQSLFRSLLAGREASKNTSDPVDFSTVVEYIHSPLLLASDDPDIISTVELSQAAAPFEVQRTQERIQLATKTTLDKTSPVEPYRAPGSAYVKHIDGNTGWEGGFFSALFYGLGSNKAGSDTAALERLRQPPSREPMVPEQAMRMRELIGRAYLLDLAVLGDSDGVVCAVSSAACRVLGVIMGWDAVHDGRWINVDDGRPWSWNGGR